MKRVLALWLLLFLSACGARGEPTGSATPGAAAPNPSANGPVYDLHEWGVVAVRQGGFEVAAGAGRPRIEMSVDKPVLYVHSEEPAPFPLAVRVDLPDTLRTAEHFPPTELTPLRWRAEVGTNGCRGQYPRATGMLDARCLDGYCEVYELHRYETSDARCLTVGTTQTPLLFYRLWAPSSPPALPLGLSLENDDVVVTRREAGGTQGSVIRIRRTGTGVLTSVTPLAESTRTTRLGVPTLPAAVGFAALRTALTDQGLTPAEAAAFLRGWQSALFGAAVPPTEAVLPFAAAGSLSDGIRADDETTDRGGDTGALPRDVDVVLYWLTPTAIDRLARIEASPPPRHLRRVFMVRHVAR